MSDPPGLLVRGAAAVATLAGGLRTGDRQGDLALVVNGVVASADGRVLVVGSEEEARASLSSVGLEPSDVAVLEARGGVVTPGLVDPHTHLLFAGSREADWDARRRGASYLDILAAGGGILSTVAATRAASDSELLAHGRRWLAEMLHHGATTVEAKSGYGLSTLAELRLLALARQLDTEGPVDVVPTFLGAHAVAPEFRDRPDATDAYVASVVSEQLPAVAAQGIARFCDVFCEAGVFSADQSRRVLSAGVAHGLRPRLHADELVPSGGAELAADVGAASADHLAAPSEAGIDALAHAARSSRPVVAVLLPATSWFLMKDRHAPARRFVAAGVPVAIGTDFNPGTSPTPSLPLAMTLAVLGLGLTPAEVLTACTINAAYALEAAGRVGSLEPRKQADLVVWRVPSVAQIPYWPAADLVAAVVKRGRMVYRAA